MLTADYALYAKGRVPYTEGLGLRQLGITTERGYIPVDGHMRTNVANIYAIGDVVPGRCWPMSRPTRAKWPLTTSWATRAPADYRAVPDCIFTMPEIASVGMTEALLRSAASRCA